MYIRTVCVYTVDTVLDIVGSIHTFVVVSLCASPANYSQYLPSPYTPPTTLSLSYPPSQSLIPYTSLHTPQPSPLLPSTPIPRLSTHPSPDLALGWNSSLFLWPSPAVGSLCTWCAGVCLTAGPAAPGGRRTASCGGGEYLYLEQCSWLHQLYIYTTLSHYVCMYVPLSHRTTRLGSALVS